MAASTISADAPSAPPYGASAGLSFKDTGTLIHQLKRGLPMTAFDDLQGAMAVPAKTLASAANIAVRTLNRRRKEGRLQTDESERLFRIAVLYDRAIEVLGDQERARAWFKRAEEGPRHEDAIAIRRYRARCPRGRKPSLVALSTAYFRDHPGLAHCPDALRGSGL